MPNDPAKESGSSVTDVVAKPSGAVGLNGSTSPASQNGTATWPSPQGYPEQSPTMQPGAAYPGQYGNNTNFNQSVNVSVGGPTIVFANKQSGPNFFVRAIWYLFIGWWLGGLAILAGYVAMFTIIGIPVAFAIFNLVPTILTLRPRNSSMTVETRDGITYLTQSNVPQYPLWMRALWFVFVGSWLGLVWLTVAWLIGLLILPLPLSIMMYNRIGGVMTLHKH